VPAGVPGPTRVIWSFCSALSIGSSLKTFAKAYTIGGAPTGLFRMQGHAQKRTAAFWPPRVTLRHFARS